ncbi:MAG: hypothetical protein RLZZ127_3117 [Planctomycetota bacterium]|jgi:hypothetical protein
MKFVCLLATLLLLLPLALGAGESHPRLLFGAKDLPGLRARATAEPYASMLARIRKDLDANDWGGGAADPGDAYDQVAIALRAAFLHCITGDEALATKARKIVEAQLAGKDWANARVKGLRLYMIGSRVALVHDLCHGSKAWQSDGFAATVSRKLKEHGEVIIQKGGGEQNNSPASNWQGSRYSAGGLCLLASDEADINPDLLKTAWDRTVRFFKENLGGSAESRGWNSEGLGYTFFPVGNYVGPFAVAMHRQDPTRDLRKAVPATGWALWTPYAVYSRAMGGIRPDFGDDNPGTAGEGCYGLAFWMCPPELQPGLVWCYDRWFGANGDRSYDNARTGTMLSYIFHPGATVKEADPITLPAWRAGFVDTGGNGFFTYRNAYRDAQDHVAQIFAKLRAPGGHAGPDALSYRFIGLGTAWAVGGGRYGPKTGGQDAYWRSQNTVYPVDPDAKLAINDKTGAVVGKPVSNPDGSGHVVLKAAQNNGGTSGHVRRFVADFAKGGAAATYVVVDSSSDGRFWQHCTVATNPISISGNTFTITGSDGATLLGTVLHPAGAKLSTGKRIRGSDYVQAIKENNFVTVSGGDGAFVVVMTVQPKGKAHPKPSATGTWAGTAAGTVTIGGLTVKVDNETIDVK